MHSCLSTCFLNSLKAAPLQIYSFQLAERFPCFDVDLIAFVCNNSIFDYIHCMLFILLISPRMENNIRGCNRQSFKVCVGCTSCIFNVHLNFG